MTPETIARSIAHQLDPTGETVTVQEIDIVSCWDVSVLMKDKYTALICRLSQRGITIFLRGVARQRINVAYEDPDMYDHIKASYDQAMTFYPMGRTIL